MTVSVYADQLVVTSVTQLTVSVCRSVGRDIGDLFDCFSMEISWS